MEKKLLGNNIMEILSFLVVILKLTIKLFLAVIYVVNMNSLTVEDLSGTGKKTT